MQPLHLQSLRESQLYIREDEYMTGSELAAPPVYEPPRGPASAVLNQQSPWWETEARKIVWSGPIELVYQLLRFRFYSRKDSLRHEIIARLTNEGKTVKLVEPNRPSPNLWSWDPRQTEGFNVEQIAEAIDRGGLSQLAHVQFEDCLGHALGYTERSVEHVVIQYRCIVFRIRCYIREYPMVAGIYQKVEELLRDRNPLAHQAVFYGLSPETPTNFCLDLICEPLRHFVDDRTLSLGAILTRLPILAVRFDHTYRQGFFPLCPPLFTIEMDTFDSLIVPSTSLEYATKMTISDRADFDSLSLQTPEARGTQLRCLVQRSNSFIIAIAECGKAYPNLNYRLNDLAQGFCIRCNWYRLAALVHGKQRAKLDSVYLRLFDPTNNFAVYRAMMKKQPGLPFLAPYLSPEYAPGEAEILEIISRVDAMSAESSTPKSSRVRHWAARVRSSK